MPDYLSVLAAAHKTHLERQEKSTALLSALADNTQGATGLEEAPVGDFALPGANVGVVKKTATTTGGTGALDVHATVSKAAMAAGARTPAQVKAWAIQESQNPTSNYYQQCQKFTRMAAGAGGGAGTAAQAYAQAKYKHTDQNAPEGSFLFWGGGAGHAAVSIGNGQAVSTDIKRKGKADIVSIADINKWLGKSHPILGWTADENGTKTKGIA